MNKTDIYFLTAFIFCVIALIFNQPFVCFAVSTAMLFILILTFFEEKAAKKVRELRKQFKKGGVK